MIRTPAHKQTNGSKLPGQLVAAPQKAPGVTKNFDRHPYLKHSTAEKQECQAVKDAANAASKHLQYRDKTLGDYYKRKMDVPLKKLTFEEWWKISKAYYGEHLETNYRFVWQEAQKNV